MADATTTDTAPATAPAPVVEAAPAPAPVAAEAASVPAAVPAPATEAPKVDAAAPAPKEVAVEAVPEIAQSPASLLEKAEGKPVVVETKVETPAPATTETKAVEPAEVKAADPVKDATAQPPPAPIKYEAFKVPDGLKLDDERVKQFTDIIGPKQLPQEDAQKLFDMHTAEMQRVIKERDDYQKKVWQTINDTWSTKTRNDPELGGNRLNTTLRMAKAVIEEYAGSPEYARELIAQTTNNGMGNNPEFIRLLHNIGRALNVYEDGIVAAPPTPPKAPKTRGNRGWYDQTMGGGTATP